MSGDRSEEDVESCRGFYAMIRFCPDADRGEFVNVGVVIGSTGIGICVLLSDGCERERRFLQGEMMDRSKADLLAPDLVCLDLARRGFVARLLEIELTREALAAWGASEAGKMQLSDPQPMVLYVDMEDEARAIFRRLVGGRCVRAVGVPPLASSTTGLGR